METVATLADHGATIEPGTPPDRRAADRAQWRKAIARATLAV
jgi:hypothetical protein